ncbi:signal recognition particle-docking protein FtsY [Desulforamulus hydrothermalis]|uniref:Signal recognition particle receptor FtsY n=1 Tax=Desulforamulus hydrothermalis Lam5 = DSM 18033 TaxID=1121428 RepID=K8EA72_9FIRM|nr:signal recognition particle-docking protein FtsY [Desulforamulus hydrothermalis]CCO08493.1 Cell division protein FtsY homolog [Desulforamulus hydrothermalis Lam5 = DSM 18033]SHH29530.1 fused signal recognition particle receptor [Desulforamulus hydrothermalis Lam5 = DSM 18033]
MGFFSRLKESLTKTRQTFIEKIDQVVTGRKGIDEELYEELEEVLIQADVGVNTAMKLVERVRKGVKARNVQEASRLKDIFYEELAYLMGEKVTPIQENAEGPTVIMVVGVNGVGKTTTIGKMAYQYKEQGKKVLLAAGDTFRAAAIDQLEIWAQRVGVDIIKHQEGSDPGAVAYDAVHAARSRNVDVLLIDTAGRLHNKSNLMDELRKVHRIIAREMPGAPHEVLLVLDATTGQNALNQAKIFSEAVNVTGIALTKLDGTAKGGVVTAIVTEMAIPVKLIGIGERMDDLRPFNPKDFIDALYGKKKDDE